MKSLEVEDPCSTLSSTRCGCLRSAAVPRTGRCEAGERLWAERLLDEEEARLHGCREAARSERESGRSLEAVERARTAAAEAREGLRAVLDVSG